MKNFNRSNLGNIYNNIVDKEKNEFMSQIIKSILDVK